MLVSTYIYRSMFMEKRLKNIGISIGKEEVTSSNLVIGSTDYPLTLMSLFFNIIQNQ